MTRAEFRERDDLQFEIRLTDDDAHDFSGPEGVDQPDGEGDQSDGDEDVADVVLQEGFDNL